MHFFMQRQNHLIRDFFLRLDIYLVDYGGERGKEQKERQGEREGERETDSERRGKGRSGLYLYLKIPKNI